MSTDAELRNRLTYLRYSNDISLDIPSGQMYCLVSRQVPAKRRCCAIAGLNISPAAIFVSTVRTVSRLHARERKVGFVFQHYALLRHMTVFDNIAFWPDGVAATTAQPVAAIKTKVTQLLEMVQLAHLAALLPAQLSGGQNNSA